VVELAGAEEGGIVAEVQRLRGERDALKAALERKEVEYDDLWARFLAFKREIATHPEPYAAQSIAHQALEELGEK
jgi:hypothetical protein